MFYDHFDTKEDFARELLGVYLEVDFGGTLGPDIEQVFRDLLYESDGDITEAVADITEALFLDSAISTEPAIHTIGWALAGTDPTVRSMLERHYRDIDGLYHSIITQALEAWGQRLRTPWTVEQLVVALRAIIDGAYARNTVSPGTIDTPMFAMQVLALVTPVLQPVDEPDHEFGEELRSVSRRNTARWRERQHPEMRVNTRRLVLESIVPALRASDTGNIDFETLATWAEVSVASIRDAFGTMEELVCTAILDSLPAMAREAEFDIQTASLSTADTFCRHVTRLAKWADSNAELAHAAVMLPLGRTLASSSAPVQRLLADIGGPTIAILEAARVAGDIEEGTEISDVSLLVTHTVLTRSVHQAGTAEMTADWLVSLTLNGISTSTSTPNKEAG